MSEWDEIKRLAADFQRTQTSDTLQRLSERNCIDIVKKLAELNLIELIYTCDGKEFLTPDHLTSEIEGEVYVNGGRIPLHDLASKIRVDYQHVETSAKELTRSRSFEYNLILGQLIHSSYKNTLSKQINDHLWLHGHLSVAEFAKALDLPSEFLLDIINELIVTNSLVVSCSSPDGQTFYTSDMMDKYRAIVVGTLSAILKPTTVASLVKRLTIPEKLFLPIVDSLIKDGRIDATVENRQFIPAIYAREQNDYITKFYESNSYIEYEMLVRMDIKQPKAFLKKKFPDGIQLKTCFVNPILLSQVESMIEETITSNSWIDICTIVSTSIEPDDIREMLGMILKKSKKLQSSCHIFDDTYVCSEGYLKSCRIIFDDLMLAKAQEDLEGGRLIEYFMSAKSKPKEQNKDNSPQEGGRGRKNSIEDISSDEEPTIGRKQRGRKSAGGAGSQGREIKQKSVKKKYFVANRASLKPSNQKSIVVANELEPLILMQTEDLVHKVRSTCSEDCSDEFLNSIVKLIEEEINKKYLEVARQVLDEYLKSQEEEEEGNSKDDVKEKCVSDETVESQEEQVKGAGDEDSADIKVDE